MPRDMDQLRYRIHNAENRKNIVLRTGKAGQLDCEVILPPAPRPQQRLAAERSGPTPLTANERSRYLANAKGMTATSSDAAQEILNRLRDNNPEPQELVDRIFHECRTNIESTGAIGDDSGDGTLMHLKGSPLGRAQGDGRPCAARPKIPARLTTRF